MSLFESIRDSLYNLDMSVHKTSLKDTFVDNFIHELRNYFIEQTELERINSLPKDSILRLEEKEDGYIRCVGPSLDNSKIHSSYNVPLSLISPDADISDYVKLNDNGIFEVVNKKNNF